MRTERKNFLDVAFDTYSEDALVGRLQSVTAQGPYEFLVTPNVDHMVRLHDRNSAIAGLSDLYHRADYCLCDSKILALLAKWRGVDLPVIPGSDLTAKIFTDVLNPGDRIAIIGGDESTPI